MSSLMGSAWEYTEVLGSTWEYMRVHGISTHYVFSANNGECIMGVHANKRDFNSLCSIMHQPPPMLGLNHGRSGRLNIKDWQFRGNL